MYLKYLILHMGFPEFNKISALIQESIVLSILFNMEIKLLQKEPYCNYLQIFKYYFKIIFFFILFHLLCITYICFLSFTLSAKIRKRN